MANDYALKYFRMEAQEHLEGMSAGLLNLERAPGDSETIKTLFRLAHTLKGSARMVALPEVGAVAHKMEDVLSLLSERGIEADQVVISAMLQAIETISGMVVAIGDDAAEQADTGPALMRLETVLSAIQLGAVEAKREPEGGAAEAPPSVAEQPLDDPLESRPAAGRDRMLRVSQDKVDHLASLTGELIINKIRMAEQNGQLQGLTHGLVRAVKAVNEVKDWANSREVRRLLSGTPQGKVLDSLLSRTRTVALGEGLKGLLSDSRSQIAHLDQVVSSLHEGVMDLRMLPAATLTIPLQLVVRDTAVHSKRRARLEVQHNGVEIDKAVLEGIREPLAHLLRNAVDHGIETPRERRKLGKPEEGRIELSFRRQGATLLVSVSDDGAGIDMDRVRAKALERGMIDPARAETASHGELLRLLTQSGFSTADHVTEVSGRGVGLDVVASDVKALSGSLAFGGEVGLGTRVDMRFPVNLSTMEGFLFASGYRTYVVPLESVVQIRRLATMEQAVCAGQPVVKVEDCSVPYVPVRRLLGGGDEGCEESVIMRWGDEQLVLGVDRVIGVRTLIIKPLADHIGDLPWVSGMTVLSSGKPAVVLDVEHLFTAVSGFSIHGAGDAERAEKPTQTQPLEPTQKRPLTVLVVDDSLSARMLEKGMLEAGGYRVVLAKDGDDGLSKLARGGIDLVVSDVEMPHMTGLEMARRIKLQEATRELPIIIVSSLGEEKDRKRGLDVGADGYLVKGELSQASLLAAVRRLVGESDV